MKRFLLTISGVAWLLGVGLGLRWYAAYEARPGPRADPPRQFPAGPGLPQQPGRATLLLFLHPRCPCSRASVAELARLMTGCPGSVVARVFFIRPDGLPGAVAGSPLWRAAAAIPGVRVAGDSRGVLARRFGVRTSGQVLLYDGFGRLRFSGGITPARGEAGDSVGRAAVLARLNGEGSGRAARAPVFGCSLLGEPEGSKTREGRK